MQSFILFDFNMVYDFLAKLNIHGLFNYLFSGYDIDECICGGSCHCYCDSMVSEKP